MIMREKDMGQTDLDILLSRIVYKTPANTYIGEIGELLAHRRADIRRQETFRHRLIRWSLAASILVAAAIGGAVHYSGTVIISRMQELSCSLPDGSEVTVMPHSDLSYNRLTWIFRRRIKLDGEAVFSVTPGRKFSVRTQAGKISVLGTRFRVKQYKQDMLVECYEGHVRVKTRVGEEILAAGQKAACDTLAITLSEIPAPLPPFISFNTVRLKEVIRNIENIFGVTVTGQDKYSDLVFTGFILTSDMDETLEAVFQSCGIPYEVSGKEIMLK